MKYFEVEFDNGYSICCRGERVPNIEEAAVFCAADSKENGMIVSVAEIDLDEAKRFFDTENMDNWPIFK